MMILGSFNRHIFGQGDLVNLQMFEEVSVLSAPIVTAGLSTLERLLLRVSPGVVSQVLLIPKLLITGGPNTLPLSVHFEVLSALSVRHIGSLIHNHCLCYLKAGHLEDLVECLSGTALKARVKLRGCADLVVDVESAVQFVLVLQFVYTPLEDEPVLRTAHELCRPIEHRSLLLDSAMLLRVFDRTLHCTQLYL